MSQQKPAQRATKPAQEHQKKSETALAKANDVAVRFTNSIMANFGDYAGQPIQLTDHQKTLAQHLFVYLDNQLKTLESKRWDKAKPPIDWRHVNLDKLAVESVKVVKAGLDAMIKNHIHAIPYLNSRTGVYDVNIEPGSAGKDFHIRQVSLYPIKDIRYELVYATDIFVPLKKSENRPVESFTHDIVNPFDRGDVVGGYIYVIYEDETRNQLIIVSGADFQKSENCSPSKKSKDGNFWANWPDEMKYKTLLRRAYDKIPKDPKKGESVTAFAALEPGVEEAAARIEEEAHEALESGPVVDIPDDEVRPADNTSPPAGRAGIPAMG